MTRSAFFWLLLLLIFKGLNIHAQPSDSLLLLNDFLSIVRQNHPLARQADNLNRSAAAEMLAARGGFDPKLYGEYGQKFFDDKNYFSLGEFGLKAPTRYAAELKAAYATSEGTFLNESDRLPSAGQAILGISMPLVQGLLLDERRANLLRARQTREMNRAERSLLLNDLYFDAIATYWKWAAVARQRDVFAEALRISEIRFQNIKVSFEQGDRMAMDTLESFIQVQDRQFQLNEAQLELQAVTAKLANFLWDDNFQLMRFPQNQRGENPASPQLDNPWTDLVLRDNLIQTLSATHPALRMYEAKLAQLDVERRLKREKLKPKLNLDYNFLGNGTAFATPFNDNYKWGISFGSSTLFRAERGDVQLAKIKIENTQLLRDQKTAELQNKLRIALAEWDNAQAQNILYQQTVDNYARLVQLENTRFELGESTLFLVNSREMKLYEAQIKLAKVQADLRVVRASIDWALGRLGE
jgi:outer membrane protein TolC